MQTANFYKSYYFQYIIFIKILVYPSGSDYLALLCFGLKLAARAGLPSALNSSILSSNN